MRAAASAPCVHGGFHTVVSSYDQGAGVLTWHELCDYCGVIVRETGRAAYRPAPVRMPHTPQHL